MPALVMKHFSPSNTQCSPSRRAVVRMAATSLPASGSVMPMAAMAWPLRTASRQRAFWASLPYSAIGA